MHANEEMLSGNAYVDASYPDADPDVINLNSDYADTDANSYIRFISMCCKRNKSLTLTAYSVLQFTLSGSNIFSKN